MNIFSSKMTFLDNQYKIWLYYHKFLSLQTFFWFKNANSIEGIQLFDNFFTGMFISTFLDDLMDLLFLHNLFELSIVCLLWSKKKKWEIILIYLILVNLHILFVSFVTQHHVFLTNSYKESPPSFAFDKIVLWTEILPAVVFTEGL